ncbi:Pr6Pr family membrane protein [Labedella endophytica]|uniref:F420-dependent oxidoreductase n=1 Tax=Labedella endophytica TaxID=1523160 RepID=A0A3S0Y0Q9_9MICO|nr:Pr6Pr family membrane protein [Labedella endophytica]RUR01523.1 hypothetical protein ELQ94_08505 [Labedella endophytica]
MTSADAAPVAARWVAVARLGLGVAILGVLGFAYLEGGDRNPFDFFGYFTNLTSLLTAFVLISTGLSGSAGRRVPGWLLLSRAVATACLLVIAVVYNAFVPGTGSAPPWVSVSLHLIVPVLVLLDWVLIGDRGALPWHRLWLILPYPAVWVAVVLIRGVTDGWVPYGFLLPERGALSLTLNVAGLLGALLLAGVIVWWCSRYPARATRASRP